MPLLHRLPMRAKFLLVLLLPLLAVLLFAGNGAFERWQLAREMRQVESLTLVAQEAGDLLHVIQRERALTTTFLNTQERSTPHELVAQRGSVDEARQRFQANNDVLTQVGLDQEAVTKLDTAIHSLDQIRQQVDSRAIPAFGAFQAYTALNNQLMELVALMSTLTHQGELVEQVASYYNLLKAKDLVSIEGGVLISVFAADRFDAIQLPLLHRLVGSQQAHVDAFLAFTTAQQRQAYSRYLESPVVSEAHGLRQRAIERSLEGGFDMDPEAWFALQTQRLEMLNEIEGSLAQHLIATSQSLRRSAHQALLGYLFTMAIIFSVVALLTWWITRSIIGPLRSSLATIATAENDLTKRLDVPGSDELSQLYRAYNDVSNGTEQMVLSIKGNAQTIQIASSEIALGNQDLAQRTEEQSSSLVQTSSSLEEITATVKQTADNAQQARVLASDLDRQAREAGTVAEQASEAMGAIKNANHKVTTIVGAIDDIAFQTNLLALNASVEAARAGEHGRGFSVVAQEVRNLAQRCASEASEIRTLVATNVEKIDEGARLVDTSSQQLLAIGEGMKEMATYVSDIAQAATEQSGGIEQIHAAMSQLEKVTQQNATLVEQAAAASRSLGDQAQAMSTLVGRYKVTEQAGGTRYLTLNEWGGGAHESVQRQH
ncbi:MULTISPECIES: methyl-accepting chemotaxis protein [Halomonadaceae]|uniref:methyl-accepting chemotaxis protein n=1 Tax=Halomonadaceae TaxID=28256 RepID=UPI0015979F38|nr:MULTISPECIES: methyl-accepting chemotaxis protein [Halomonas]QJQ94683.1 HAMP domain-containing protein [Halomonas sp. PA5]